MRASAMDKVKFIQVCSKLKVFLMNKNVWAESSGQCSLWDTFIIIRPFRLISTIYQLFEKMVVVVKYQKCSMLRKQNLVVNTIINWIQMGIIWWWLWVNNHSAVVLIDMVAVVDTNNCEFFCSSGGGPHTPSLLGTVTSSWKTCDSSFEKRISMVLSPSCYWQQTGWNLKFNKEGILGRWK